MISIWLCDMDTYRKNYFKLIQCTDMTTNQARMAYLQLLYGSGVWSSLVIGGSLQRNKREEKKEQQSSCLHLMPGIPIVDFYY